MFYLSWFRSFVGCYTCIIQYHFYSKIFFFFFYCCLSLFLFESFYLSACKSSFNFSFCFFLSQSLTHAYMYIFFHLGSSRDFFSPFHQCVPVTQHTFGCHSHRHRRRKAFGNYMENKSLAEVLRVLFFSELIVINVHARNMFSCQYQTILLPRFNHCYPNINSLTWLCVAFKMALQQIHFPFSFLLIQTEFYPYSSHNDTEKWACHSNFLTDIRCIYRFDTDMYAKLLS